MARSTEISSGLLMYDIDKYGILKVLLCHCGGPYFDDEIKHPRAWGIAKGKVEDNESIIKTAVREFTEETGIIPKSPYLPLGNVIYKNGKIVNAFAFSGKYPGFIKSNNFNMEWPPKSGKIISVPEIDKADMFTIDKARKKIMISQEPFLDKLVYKLKFLNII